MVIVFLMLTLHILQKQKWKYDSEGYLRLGFKIKLDEAKEIAKKTNKYIQKNTLNT